MRGDRDVGYTLLEALAALAITAGVVASLGALAGQWLPSWRHGFVALQNADLIGVALDRVIEELASAEYAGLEDGQRAPLFRGEVESVTFLRQAIGPGAAPRLEVVQIGAVDTRSGVEVDRVHANFAPSVVSEMRDPVTLLRAPFTLVFAYSGPDGIWRTRWTGEAKLPRAVRLQVRGQGGEVVTSTAFMLKLTAPPEIGAQLQPQSPPRAGGKNE